MARRRVPAGFPAALVAATLGLAAPAGAEQAPAAEFLDNLAELCGRAFEGQITANQPASSTPDPFDGKRLVMHVRTCNEDEIRIPFQVGDDRSRTWVIRRSTEALRLKHDHRHEDGSADPVTWYGGAAAADGSAERQTFPVDAESQENFRANGLDASLNNTWALELRPGHEFVYELARPSGRLFRVRFDLSQPVPAPPPPWGSQ